MRKIAYSLLVCAAVFLAVGAWSDVQFLATRNVFWGLSLVVHFLLAGLAIGTARDFFRHSAGSP